MEYGMLGKLFLKEETYRRWKLLSSAHKSHIQFQANIISVGKNDRTDNSQPKNEQNQEIEKNMKRKINKKGIRISKNNNGDNQLKQKEPTWNNKNNMIRNNQINSTVSTEKISGDKKDTNLETRRVTTKTHEENLEDATKKNQNNTDIWKLKDNIQLNLSKDDCNEI
ncbi:uncharacterized protein LOC127097672 [Lathyrus oleraceus]|uniref:uncharacterized protein LOC127097672 n=1 Tax=Pisum sativum TaxID=3888 RepID=UPI0021CE0FA1|nr:uncharacterized protein LOC127097672 [Pisum sativum]